MNGWRFRMDSGTLKNKKIKALLPYINVAEFSIIEIVEDHDLIKEREDFYIKQYWGNELLLNRCPTAFSNIGLKFTYEEVLAQRSRATGKAISELIKEDEDKAIIKSIPQKRVSQFDLNGVFIFIFDSIRDAAKRTGTETKNISCVLSGRYIQTMGHVFTYVNEDGSINYPIIRLHKNKEKGIKISQYEASGKLIKTYDSKSHLLREIKMDGRDLNRLLLSKCKRWKGFTFNIS